MTALARLTAAREIKAVFDARVAVGTPSLVVHGRRREHPDTRAAVVAGRKVGGAVQRNRAKRRLRAALQALDVPAGLDLVVTARPPAVDAPFASVTADLRRGMTGVQQRCRTR